MTTIESRSFSQNQPRESQTEHSSIEIKPVIDGAVWSVDIREMMPSSWKEQIDKTVEKHAKHSNLEGGAVSTSLAPKDYVTSYDVVTGDAIEVEMPWLMDLFRGRLRQLTEQLAGRLLVPSENVRAGVNINTMDRATQKSGYELHTDSNPWTVLLARHTMHDGDGGELVFKRSPEEKDVEIGRVQIQEGHVYIFDGQTHPHQVLILTGANRRSTVPLNYWGPGEEAKRPADLDAGLYGNSA